MNNMPSIPAVFCRRSTRNVIFTLALILLAGGAVLIPASSPAASTWTGLGATGNWSTTGNWSPVPTFPTALTFAGSTQLANTNDNTGITVSGFTFDVGAGAFVLSGNNITLNGGIAFSANPAAPVTQTINLNMALNASETIDVPANGNLILGSNLTSTAALVVTTIDSGTVTLGGVNTIGGLSVDGLTGSSTTITGNTTINGTAASYVGSNEAVAGCKATLIIQPGAKLTVSGSLADSFVIGRDGGSGTVVQNGGTFIFSPSNGKNLLVGATGSSNTRAEYDMNGGLLNLSGNQLGIGWAATSMTGLVSQVSGVITNLNNLLIPDGNSANGIGIYTLSGGSIYIGGGGITTGGGSDRYAISLGGGTVGAYASWSSALNLNLRGSNGPVTFSTAANTITLSGVLSGSGGLTKIGSGTLILSGANSYTGDTTVNVGTLQLNLTGSSLGAFHLASGAMLNLNYSGTYTVAICYTNGVPLPAGVYTSGNLPGFVVGTGSLQVLSTGVWTGLGSDNNWSTAANWNSAPAFPTTLTFAGTTRLTNTNDLTGITASSLTFDVAAGAFVLNGNGITNSGGIGIAFNGNPAAPVTQTVNLNMALSASQTFDTPANGNLTVGGNLTSVNDLYKIDAGTLTLGGSNTIESLGVDGGTNIITGNTTVNGNSAGGNYDRCYVGEGEHVANCFGTLVIQPGAVLTVTGSFNDCLVIGRDNGSGRVIQNGGTFAYNPANQTLFLLGASAAANTSEYDMNGGLLNLSGKILAVGLGNGASNTDTLSQASGVITNVLNLALPSSGTSAGLSVYTLSGGSIYIGGSGITTAGGSSRYAISLGGGKVGAYASWSSSLNLTLTNLNGSVTFDTAANTITLSGALTSNGGLTKIGSGRLILSGVNTYTGDTTVNAGTLQLNGAGGSPGVLRMTNGAVLNLNFAGTNTVISYYTNGVALPAGVYVSSNLPGYITGTGGVNVGGSTGLWTGGGVDNNWSTAGNWNNGAVPIFPMGLTFAGATRLTNTNNLTGITARGITFDAAAGAFVLAGNGNTNSGSIGFNGNPAAPVTQTVNLNQALSASQTIDTPTNGNLSLGGAITTANDLYKIDAGTLTLGGTNMMVDLGVDGGTNIITGSTTLNGNTGGGNYDRFYVGEGEHVANCFGTLILQPGAALTVSNSFNDSFVIGRDDGSGRMIQNGGTFNYNPANQTSFYIGASVAANTAEYDMNGGLLNLNGKTLAVGLGNGPTSTNTLIQTGGVITNVLKLGIPSNQGQNSGLSVYTMSGGSIYIGASGITIGGSPSRYIINLGGGTVGASANWSSSLNMTLTGINGSATFDTATNNIVLSGTLTGGGGLTKIGSGTITLTGANTYQGSNTIIAGKLITGTFSTGGGNIAVADGAGLGVVVETANAQLSAPAVALGNSNSASIDFDLGSFGNPTLAPLNVTALLAVNGVVTINILSNSVMQIGEFPLIKYAARTGSGSFVIGSLPPGAQAGIVTNLANSSIDLVVNGAAISTIVTANFDGQGGTGWTPPDAHAAVGPNHIISWGNNSLMILNKNGKVISSQDATTFFGFSTGGDGHVIYDEISGRFALEVLSTNASVGFAVSDTSDPTGSWHKINISVPGLWDGYGGNGIGYNADAYVVHVNGFNNQYAVIAASNNVSLAYTMITAPGGVRIGRPASMTTATTGGPFYFVEGNDDGVNGQGGTLGTIDVVAVSNILSGSPTYADYPVPATSGEASVIYVSWRNNLLGVIGATGSPSVVNWYLLSTSNTASLLQSGTIVPVGGADADVPSIAVAPDGSLAVNYTAANSGSVTAMYVAGRLATDPAGTMRAPQQVISGPTTDGRWGDFSSCVVDINSAGIPQNSFWACNEYLIAPGQFNWRDRLANFSISAPSAIAVAGTLYVDLRASDLVSGTATWTNRAAAGNFAPDGTDTPVLGAYQGVWAVQLDGNDGYKGPNTTASLLSGNAPRTIEAWVNNPSLADEETTVSLGQRGTTDQNFAFNYGSNTGWGALAMQNDDLGWNTIPAANAWHYLVVTFDGTNLLVYRDGLLDNSATRTAATPVDPIWIGSQTTDGVNPSAGWFSGYLNSIRIHTGVLSRDQIAANYVMGTATLLAPSTPTGLAATASSTQISLNWYGSSGATGYNVKRSTTNGGAYTLVGSSSATNFQDVAVANGLTYYYVVSATNAAGESPNSTQASAIMPRVTLAGVVQTKGQFTLQFLGANNQSYVVEVSTNLVNWLPVATNTTTGGMFSFTDTNASAPAQFYRVRQ